jgi:hypothetical protein
MTQPLHQPSQGTRYSLYYITIGSVTVIWSGVWYYWLRHSATPLGDSRFYVCTGLLLTGLAFLVIGVLIGRIGKEASHADVPVGTVTAAAVKPGDQPNKDNNVPANQVAANQAAQAGAPVVPAPAPGVVVTTPPPATARKG